MTGETTWKLLWPVLLFAVSSAHPGTDLLGDIFTSLALGTGNASLQDTNSSFGNCVQAFRTGHFRTAIQNCVKLSDDSSLVATTLENLDSILQFVSLLATPHQLLQAYDGLFEELVNHGKIVHPIMLVLGDIVLDNTTLIPAVLSPTRKIEHQQLKTKVENVVDVLLLDLAYRIRAGDVSWIKDYTFSSQVRSSLSRHLPTIIQRACSNSAATLGNIDQFIEALPSSKLKLEAYKLLLDELNRAEEADPSVAPVMIKLAFRVRQIEHEQLQAPLLESVKATLAGETRQLFWHEDCTIRNVAFNGYLRVGAEDHYGHRDVITTAGQCPNLTTEEVGHWKLDAELEHDNVYFRIRNQHYKKMLLTQLKGERGRHDCDRRNVFAAAGEHNIQDMFQTWEVLPSRHVCPRCYTIRTKHFNGFEYMYAGAEHERKHRTWTWIPGDLDPQGEWEIICN